MYFLSVHVVFILNENIKWLEEFIIYHRHIGVEHFYLYDNEGSCGGDGTTTHNKYGFAINTTSTEEERNQLNMIVTKYKDIITHVMWQPKNKNGQVYYGQYESLRHFSDTYGKYTTWVACIDLDEFIFSVKNVNLVEYLQSLADDISCVYITQKKFLDRFLTNEHFITQEYSCITNYGPEWGGKNIVRCKDFAPSGDMNIHYNMNTKNKRITPDPDILRFHHYNVNQKQLRWMKGFFHCEYISLDGTDNGMERYKYLFHSD